MADPPPAKERPITDLQENLVTRLDCGPVSYLALNRPQRGNSLSLAMIDALHRRLLELRSEAGIGVIVLSGVGQKSFVPGMT